MGHRVSVKVRLRRTKYLPKAKTDWERALLQFSSRGPVATAVPPPASGPAGTSCPPTPPKSRAPWRRQRGLGPSVSCAGVCLSPLGLVSWPWPSSSFPGLSSPPLFFFWTTIKIQSFRRHGLRHWLSFQLLPHCWGEDGSFRFPRITQC